MAIDVARSWPELASLFFLIIGLLLSLTMASPAVSYMAIFVSGLFAGRLLTDIKGQRLRFPSIMLIVGFFIGYLLGAYYTSRFWSAIFFVLGAYISFRLYSKGKLKDSIV